MTGFKQQQKKPHPKQLHLVAMISSGEKEITTKNSGVWGWNKSKGNEGFLEQGSEATTFATQMWFPEKILSLKGGNKRLEKASSAVVEEIILQIN